MLAHNNTSPEALNAGTSPVLLLSPATSPSRSSSSSLLSQSRSLSPTNASGHHNINSQNQLSSKNSNVRNSSSKVVTNSLVPVTASAIDNAAVTVVNETNAKFGLITLKTASTNLVGINVLNVPTVPTVNAVHTFPAINRSNDLKNSDDTINGNNNFTARFASLTDFSELSSVTPAKREQEKYNMERVQNEGKRRSDGIDGKLDNEKQIKAKFMREKQQIQKWQDKKKIELDRKDEIRGKRKNQTAVEDEDYDKHKQIDEDDEEDEDYEEDGKEEDEAKDEEDDDEKEISM